MSLREETSAGLPTKFDSLGLLIGYLILSPKYDLIVFGSAVEALKLERVSGMVSTMPSLLLSTS